MSHGGIDHEITGCPGCDAAAHEKAVQEQQKTEPVASVGLVLAATFICLVVVALWTGVMTLLSQLW
ncbi:hypothetical protein SAMN05216268_11794 [Streptomyces yunnanensis]|uniref:Uncharacterized protein n=1 Tax=Streptomyces yunnanensis TaxID=156453 RepID=A0A9X8N4X8_9ACTN|nr:hypothetical protein SAMN05216268_11794 [Streptomyces yunnanensis]